MCCLHYCNDLCTIRRYKKTGLEKLGVILLPDNYQSDQYFYQNRTKSKVKKYLKDVCNII
jgi:hypothetical protein